MISAMRAVEAGQILELWEQGRAQAPLDRCITMVHASCPELDLETCRTLPVGELDARLLELRELSLGSRLEGYVECPHCRAPMTFETDTRELLALAGARAQPGTREIGGFELDIRSPNTADLIEASFCENVEAARDLLVARCVCGLTRDGVPTDLAELPTPIVRAVAAEVQTLNPLADILLDMQCPSCANTSQAELDIASFVWSELESRARRLLREVDLLARAYGWTEAQILTLSPERRRCYLELVTT